MKKAIALILVIMMVAALVSCGTDKSLADVAKGYIGRDFSELVKEIGNPISGSYQDSCENPDAQEGFHDYKGFTVVTLKDDNGETVQRIDVE